MSLGDVPVDTKTLVGVLLKKYEHDLENKDLKALLCHMIGLQHMLPMEGIVDILNNLAKTLFIGKEGNMKGLGLMSGVNVGESARQGPGSPMSYMLIYTCGETDKAGLKTICDAIMEGKGKQDEMDADDDDEPEPVRNRGFFNPN